MNPLMTPFSPTPHAGHFAGFCKSYVPPRGGGGGGAAGGLFDEMEEPDGSVRPHWMMFSSLLDDLGPAELQRRWETARQLIHDNGVTYNVYGDPAGMDRPWNLDAIPMLFDPVEWARVETALIQRAQLLDMLLADIYGPQRLLREGLIPPELIFAHRGYLRAMHGAKLPQGRWLHKYAADVARSPDGQLWIISDRTQAPSGAGYALENRLVISRALPDVFRDCRVRRLALFFRTMRDSLESLSPQNKDNPRIVLLTPGPFNETYFEHAYLARYLGYTLVEGGDLTVRDNKVYLKTLGGLQQVDVIMRRQDDEFCDPLELRTDSALGVAGLVQAVQSGNVAVANALGTGLLETPALMMFLPRLCKHLLVEELRLPSVGRLLVWRCRCPQPCPRQSLPHGHQAHLPQRPPRSRLRRAGLSDAGPPIPPRQNPLLPRRFRRRRKNHPLHRPRLHRRPRRSPPCRPPRPPHRLSRRPAAVTPSCPAASPASPPPPIP